MLSAHHEVERGVWAVMWRSGSGRTPVRYEHLVEEALCFGWIDSTVNVLDDDRRLHMVDDLRPGRGPRRARCCARRGAEPRTNRIEKIVAEAASGRRAWG